MHTALESTRGPILSFSLLGKKAFVTGGSRGIGRACALTLAAAGADVAVSSSPTGADSAEAVCLEIREMGRRAKGYSFDVGVQGDVVPAVALQVVAGVAGGAVLLLLADV